MAITMEDIQSMVDERGEDLFNEFTSENSDLTTIEEILPGIRERLKVFFVSGFSCGWKEGGRFMIESHKIKT